MTWSIVAREPASGALGVAIASRFLAVGAVCPFVASGALALSTQAVGHMAHGPAALALHRRGQAPDAIIAALLAGDAERDRRQIHLVDAGGRVAAHTGRHCQGWAGSVAADGVSVAGNLLAGPEVVAVSLAAYEAASQRPLAERLLRALEAGQAAGGDARGQQAAALLIHAGAQTPMLSLRVDDDGEAVAALRRLHAAAAQDYYPALRAQFPAEDVEQVIGR